MPNNGMPTPKVVLTQQANLPKLALANSPLSALGEGVTGVLANIAAGLPEMGAVPGTAMAPPAGLTNLFKSLEATLPAGLPKFGEMGKAAPTREAPPPPAPARGAAPLVFFKL